MVPWLKVTNPSCIKTKMVTLSGSGSTDDTHENFGTFLVVSSMMPKRKYKKTRTNKQTNKQANKQKGYLSRYDQTLATTVLASYYRNVAQIAGIRALHL